MSTERRTAIALARLECIASLVGICIEQDDKVPDKELWELITTMAHMIRQTHRWEMLLVQDEEGNTEYVSEQIEGWLAYVDQARSYRRGGAE